MVIKRLYALALLVSVLLATCVDARAQSASGANPTDTVRVSGGIMAGQLINNPRISYPEAARQACIQGTVVLSVTIEEAGSVTSAKPLSGDPALVPTAISSVLQRKYKPYFVNGRPVAVNTEVKIDFVLPGCSTPQVGQPSAQLSSANSLVGTIQGQSGRLLTVMKDSGSLAQVQLDDSIVMVRVQPGAKDLSNAVRVLPENLQIGDRISAGGKLASDGITFAAQNAVVMAGTGASARQGQTAATVTPERLIHDYLNAVGIERINTIKFVLRGKASKNFSTIIWKRGVGYRKDQMEADDRGQFLSSVMVIDSSNSQETLFSWTGKTAAGSSDPEGVMEGSLGILPFARGKEISYSSYNNLRMGQIDGLGTVYQFDLNQPDSASTYTFSAGTHLLLRQDTHLRYPDGASSDLSESYSDYRTIGGFTVPFNHVSISTNPYMGGRVEQEVSSPEDLQINIPIDEQLFTISPADLATLKANKKRDVKLMNARNPNPSGGVSVMGAVLAGVNAGLQSSQQMQAQTNAQIGQIAAAAQQTANQRAEAQHTAPVQIINPVTLAPVSSSSTAPPASNPGASASYSGPYSDWVHKLLSRVGAWSCPSSMSATDGKPPQVQTEDISFRDQYVKAAVLDAWTAECYTRQEHDNEAQAKAQNMMKNLKTAEALCSGNPPCQSGPTAGIYHCGELQPGARVVPQCDGSATAYAYYEGGASSVDRQLNVTIFTTALQIPYEPDEAANSPLDMDHRVDTVVNNSARALAPGLGPVDPGFGIVVIGPKQKADLQIESAMNDLYNKDLGYHDPYNTYLIFLVDANSGAVIRRLQVNKAPKPAAPTGAGVAR